MSSMAGPSDQTRRDAILDESLRNVSVQASAGTGKTTLMVERVVRLVKRGIPVDRIAVVTFTDAAAAELRLRIRSRLREEAGLGVPECGKALEGIASAWISTIHGFASRVLREYFNLTGVDPSFVTTESHFTPLEVSREWNSWLTGLEPAADERELLSRTTTSVQKMIAMGMEERRWLVSQEMVGGTETVMRMFEEFMETRGTEVESVLEGCASPSDKLCAGGREFLDSLAELEGQMPLPAPDTILRADRAINLGSGRAGNWPDKDRAKAVLGAARDKFREIAPVLGSGRLAELSWHLAGSFARELRSKWDSDRSRLSYDDLLYTAWKAISGSGRLAECLAGRFDHVLIDEFQDTSREQTAIFRAFMERDGTIPQGRITVVADDKQSIYGWRNADIETYNDFRERLERGGALSQTITTNFRSSRNIIRFINSFGRELFLSQAPEELRFGCDYSPIQPSPKAAEGRPVRVLSIPSMPNELKATQSAPSWSARVQAEWFAEYVGDGMRSGQAPEDYALLFRSGTHMHHFVDSLERENIPYRMASAGDFLRRQEVVDLREMLRCLVYPSDTLAWVHTLRSLFFGIPDPRISLALSSGSRGFRDICPVPEVERAGRSLRRLRRALLNLPLADLLQELLLQTEMVPVVCAGGYQVTRRLGNLQRVLERVLSGEAESPVALLNLLDERYTPGRPEEPSTVPLEGGAVTLSSIHSAKGLAWKHVVLAGLPARSGGSRDRFISYDHGRMAAFDLGLSADPAGRIRMKSPLWPEITSLEKARETAESRRLIYVAVTRARDSLVVLAAPVAGEGSGDAAIMWESVCRAAGKDPECCVMEELEPGEVFTPGTARRTPGIGAESTGYLYDTPLFTVDPRPEGWQPGGAFVGDCVHAVMEKIDMKDPEGWFRRNREYLERVYGNDLEEVRTLCLNFFTMDLPFDLKDSSIVGREYHYFVNTPEGIRKRYIDLLLRTPEGRLTVVDYKTDRLKEDTRGDVIGAYMETQRHYIEDIGRLFGEPVRGHLAFLRHLLVRDAPEFVN